MLKIILFDGYCNLCNHSVRFIVKRDKKKKFKYISLQSAEGEKIISNYKIHIPNLDTIVYIKNNTYYVRSRAVLEILKDLGGLWKMSFAFIIIPATVRDFIYNQISKYRYKVFGRTQCCELT